MFLVGLPPFARNANTKIIDELTNLGLKSGLVVCLDAGDSASYDGTSQTWTDVSGNSNSFFRGGTSGATSADPTFHGTANARSVNEYFQSDGGDAFWQASSQTWMSTWHKAGATFTIGGWVYVPSTASGPGLGLFRNWRDNSDLGVTVTVYDAPFVTMSRAAGTGSGQSMGPVGVIGVLDQWKFALASFAEGTGTSFSQVNGSASLLVSDTYSSPSSTTAPNGIALMGVPNAAGTGLESAAVNNDANQRINCMMAWSRALSQSEVLAIYNATKGKFGF